MLNLTQVRMKKKETQTGTVKAHISASFRAKRAIEFCYGASKFSIRTAYFPISSPYWLNSLENWELSYARAYVYSCLIQFLTHTSRLSYTYLFLV